MGADPVSVWRGKHGDPVPLFGPLPGMRSGEVVAYEFELPARFIPWPGRTRLERTFVLLDLGVVFANVCWREVLLADGRRVEGLGGPDRWYVDLIEIEAVAEGFVFRDLYIDAIVAAGMPYRTLDLDEFADAMHSGVLDTGQAAEGLRRWQHFLDRHLHRDRNPRPSWSDFPPQVISDLAALASPLGPIVQTPD